jgi:hypothetical protein
MACQRNPHSVSPSSFQSPSPPLRFARFPNTKLWITEFADPNASLSQCQTFFNSTMQLLDSTDYVERYSYFGAFRSTDSNVGPNATFLNANGKLTDIGSWYLGGAATSNTPSASGASHVRHISGLNIAVGSIVSTAMGWIVTTGLGF